MDSLEANNALVSYRRCRIHGLHRIPNAFIFIFDIERAHALSQRDVFLEDKAVHVGGRRKGKGKRACNHAILSCPIGIPVAVGYVACAKRTPSARRGFHVCPLEQVRLEISLNSLVPLHRTCRVLRRDASVESHREVEQEVGIVSHTPVVQVHQLSQGFQLMVFAFVVEPARTDRHVAFAAEPVLLVLIAVGTVLVIADGGLGVVDAPLGCTSPAVFVAYPANVRHGAAEYHGRRVLGLDFLAGTFVIIIGLCFDRTLLVGSAIPAVAAVGSIEPELEEGAVVGD